MKKLALLWWGNLSTEERHSEIKHWKANTGDYRRHWDYSLISRDELAIEAIFLFKRTEL